MEPDFIYIHLHWNLAYVYVLGWPKIHSEFSIRSTVYMCIIKANTLWNNICTYSLWCYPVFCIQFHPFHLCLLLTNADYDPLNSLHNQVLKHLSKYFSTSSQILQFHSWTLFLFHFFLCPIYTMWYIFLIILLHSLHSVPSPADHHIIAVILG